MDERTAVWNIPYSGFCFLTQKYAPFTAFKDPRGRFGISNTLPGAVRGPRRARE